MRFRNFKAFYQRIQRMLEYKRRIAIISSKLARHERHLLKFSPKRNQLTLYNFTLHCSHGWPYNSYTILYTRETVQNGKSKTTAIHITQCTDEKNPNIHTFTGIGISDSNIQHLLELARAHATFICVHKILNIDIDIDVNVYTKIQYASHSISPRLASLKWMSLWTGNRKTYFNLLHARKSLNKISLLSIISPRWKKLPHRMVRVNVCVYVRVNVVIFSWNGARAWNIDVGTDHWR